MPVRDQDGNPDVSSPTDPGTGPGTHVPATEPWTAAELQAAQTWAQQYYTSHKIPNTYGTVDDLINNYMAQRRAGVGHQGAMDAVPGILGWDKYTPPPTPDTPPPPTGGAPPPPPSTGGNGGPLPGAPTFTAPSYTPPPAMQAPPAVSYGDFVAPNPNHLNSDPAYQYELKTQQAAIQRSAA